jgi:hypothetical protein
MRLSSACVFVVIAGFAAIVETATSASAASAPSRPLNAGPDCSVLTGHHVGWMHRHNICTELSVLPGDLPHLGRRPLTSRNFGSKSSFRR